MFQINEISAAPHMPHDRKSHIGFSRPESLASMLTYAAEGSNDLEVMERNGEIFVALSAAS